MKALVSRGCGKEIANSIGGRALHCAVSSEDYQTVKALMDKCGFGDVIRAFS